jgi:hypothetical protein
MNASKQISRGCLLRAKAAPSRPRSHQSSLGERRAVTYAHWVAYYRASCPIRFAQYGKIYRHYKGHFFRLCDLCDLSVL